MPIIYHQQSKEFHLYNESVSYIMQIMANGQMGNLYYGKRIADRDSYSYLYETGVRPHAALSCSTPAPLCLQYTRQEYPLYGTGDYRYGAYEIKQENGSRITNYTYVSHRIAKGKPSLEPLPATYVEADSEASTLEIKLHDEVLDTDLFLLYTIMEEAPVLTRSVRFEHHGTEEIVLTNGMSASIDLPDKDYNMIHLSGAWSRERMIKKRPLEQGIQSIYSMRGISSAEHNPFLALASFDTTEEHGRVYGFSLVYSGSFLAQAEVCSHDTTRVLLGIHPDTFEWPLKSGESFQTPEVVMVYTEDGLTGMSQIYHRLYKTRLARGYWRDRERPVLLNNWEATYMDFNEEKILTIARKAKDAGVELFVLDDGWFGERNNDDRSLGDWFVNRDKLPNGIGGLSEKIEAMGLKFGLWIEPEMVNKNSRLYEAHPDWILSVPHRYETPSRQQHVLDFSRKEVVDSVYCMLKEIIGNAKISYIKWDMNRYLTECYSKGTSPDRQGMVMHKYILGVYDLYSRLLKEFPKILFESCASGGARFDPGLLYYAPQGWCSDNTDALDRLKIQYGTSLVYPISSMGAHISAVPNHQVHRITPLKTRGNTAVFGAFGYELDLNQLSEEEMKLVKKQIAWFKENRSLLHQGIFHRLKSPFEGNDTSWMVVSPDKEEAIVAYYQILNSANAGSLRLKLKGLNETLFYRVTIEENTGTYYGSELMYAGIPIDRNLLNGDFASLLIQIKKAEQD
ncbi:alpha-galactosidase [Clostridium sp. E02]|uniref:alpha-galactosidase n=1 Tax=Clostridium sp. E02 TaxID=2487134 RepID=UPI000F51B83F|nr:alpha-galactosidase [Clostridium sp. E02]